MSYQIQVQNQKQVRVLENRLNQVINLKYIKNTFENLNMDFSEIGV